MLRKIGYAWASRLSLLLFGAIIIYHILILLQVIPYDLTWGGRLESTEQMYRFETVSLALNVLFFMAVFIKSRRVIKSSKTKVLNALLWLMGGLFALNTLGNLMALNSLETIIFTPITFVLTILCWRLALE